MLLISTGQEKKLGEDEYQKFLKDAKLSNDREKVEMIRRIGRRMAKASGRPDFQWEFNLVEDDKTVNAWCLPGGKVAVYTGILPVAETETGLAVVMGHEIAHALARHGGERMSQGMVAQFGASALSVALGGQSGAVRKLAQDAYGMGVGVGILLPFSRSHEAEADHIGLVLMAKAGYDPRESVEFWKRMAGNKEGAKDSPLARYLSTHPSDVTRQENLRGWMEEALKEYQR
ncbi:MAG: M48 family metallopeptidase [Elusimicrobia bacterium]|nr:M48 family metallopeptidase [Elusimicrobiota bacterium]